MLHFGDSIRWLSWCVLVSNTGKGGFQMVALDSYEEERKKERR